MKPVYSSRFLKIHALLLEIAKNGQVYQSMLAPAMGTSYRNLIRQLHYLEKAGLIKIARKEPSSKKGKERNVWELSFKGLLACFSLDLPLEMVDVIAQRNREKWLLFQEWEHFDQEIKRFIITNLQLYAKEHDIWAIKNLKQPLLLSLPKRFVENMLQKEATLKALGLDVIFDFGIIEPIFDENNPLSRLWKICVSNPAIRTFIIELFVFEAERHKNIETFHQWLFKDLSPEKEQARNGLLMGNPSSGRYF
ncbi:MAG: hypothetical protein QW805_05930 [Candidatus Bathyarchaeia archaeon]